jgi:hypothetical protein
LFISWATEKIEKLAWKRQGKKKWLVDIDFDQKKSILLLNDSI